MKVAGKWRYVYRAIDETNSEQTPGINNCELSQRSMNSSQRADKNVRPRQPTHPSRDRTTQQCPSHAPSLRRPWCLISGLETFTEASRATRPQVQLGRA